MPSQHTHSASARSSHDSPEQQRPGRRGLMVKVVAVALVGALVFGAGFTAFSVFGGEPRYQLSLGDTVAQMPVDEEAEQENQEALGLAGDAFESIAEGQDDAGTITTEARIYSQDNQDRGPVGDINLVAATVEGRIDPDALVERWTEVGRTNDFETRAIDSDEESAAACATSEGTGQTTCIWATSTTYVQLIPSVNGWTSEQLGSLLAEVRADVESTE